MAEVSTRMDVTVLNGPVIPAGEFLSNALDCSAGKILRITMPYNWPFRSVVTFQISSDGSGYNDLFDADGHEINIYAVAGTAVIVPDALGRAAAFIKFRSGTRDSPIPQPTQQEFAVAIEPYATTP